MVATNTYRSVRQVLSNVYDPTNKLLNTSATISGDVNVDSTSINSSGITGKASGTNADFITAYASGTTITCTTLPSGISSIKADDIISIVQIAVSGAVTNTYTRDDVTITAGGTDPTTLTVAGATFLANDTFVIYTNIPQTRGDKVDLIEIAGVATNVDGGNRDTGTQTVTLADDDPTIANQTNKTQMSQITDGTNEVDVIATINSAKIDTSSVAGTATNVNGGNRDAGTQTTTLADDDPAVASLGIMDDWDATHDSAIGNDGAVVMAQARDGQLTAVAEDDASRLIANLYGELVTAGYTWATSSNRAEEIDPVDEHYVEEELIDDTDVTAATDYYPSSTGKSMGNFNNVSIHGVTTGGVTTTIEVKIDDSTDWIDVTLAGYDLLTNTTNNTSFVDKSFLLDFDALHVRNIRIKSITSDSTNAVQYHWKLTAL